MFRFFFLFLFVFSNGITFSQNITKQDLILAISKLRSEILTRNENYTQEYDEVVTMLIKSKINGKRKSELIKQLDELIFNFGKEIVSLESFLLEKRKFKKDSLLNENKFMQRYISLQDRLCNSAYKLSDMAFYKEVLNQEFPYSINIKNDFFEIFDEIEFKENDVVLDLGCGLGTLSIIYALLDTSLIVYAQEISDSKLNLLQEDLNESKLDLSNISLVKGDKRSTTLEHVIFDKIIVYNTFHHFTKDEEMMQSIIQSMDENTKLIIFDPDRNISEVTDKHYCTEIIKAQELEEKVLKHPLVLVKKKPVNTWVYWEFKLK